MLRPATKAPTQKAHLENPMNSLHYIGFDVHKKAISFCVKTAAGEIVEEGSVLAQREVLQQWASARPQPWRGATFATIKNRGGPTPVQSVANVVCSGPSAGCEAT